MSEVLSCIPLSESEFLLKKEAHLDRISDLRNACEIEMFSYIERYILNDQNLGDVFPVAHKSLVDDVISDGYTYGHYVLEHIIEYERIFIDESYTLDCYKAIFNAVPESRKGVFQ